MTEQITPAATEVAKVEKIKTATKKQQSKKQSSKKVANEEITEITPKAKKISKFDKVTTALCEQNGITMEQILRFALDQKSKKFNKDKFADALLLDNLLNREALIAKIKG